MNIDTRFIHTCCHLLKEQPKNLRGKKHSSQLWLTRQIRDPYVEKARRENYRCRSAFKLIEINERYKILSPGQTIIDCGAAPGSWSQVAAKFVNSTGKESEPTGTVIAIDRLPIHPIEGVITLGKMDFTLPRTHDALIDLLKGKKADVVLSDMAPNASGVGTMDHDIIIKLVYFAFKFAIENTKPNGTFLAKVWDGERSYQLEEELSRFYNSVKSVRPKATRDESTEKYFLARGFKGLKHNESRDKDDQK